MVYENLLFSEKKNVIFGAPKGDHFGSTIVAQVSGTDIVQKNRCHTFVIFDVGKKTYCLGVFFDRLMRCHFCGCCGIRHCLGHSLAQKQCSQNGAFLASVASVLHFSAYFLVE